MSYIDAVNDKSNDKIHVVERNLDGEREFKEYPINYTMYFEDNKGKSHSIYGDRVSRFSTFKKAEFDRERRMHSGKKLFESDINPVFRCLSENYLKIDAPKLHTCFFDIEVDFDPAKGFSPPSDPFNPVTAVSLYLDWLDQLVCLAVPPSHMTYETAQEAIKDFPDTLLFRTEKELFDVFFTLIEDADVMSGWNSEGYDIPYMVNRVTRVMSKDDTRKFCLLGQFPKKRIYERFGKEEETFDLVGRIHLDYLALYKKYNYESRHSYKLDAIGELEVGEKKTEYEGSLDQLYNKDFKKFIEYNRQDTMLLKKLDDKLQFMELANQMAHENTVLLPTVMGSVAMIEMAIMNEAHERGMVVPDKKRRSRDDDVQGAAAGAYVMTPKKGLHDWIGSIDINSLYPSVIRALNMAPETIVGQVKHTLTDQYMLEKGLGLAQKKSRYKKGDASVEGPILWEGLFGSLEYTAIQNQERGTMLTIDYEDGRSEDMSAAQIWKMIYDSNNPFILSANGTIFRSDIEGVIPGLLSKWYSDRKVMQAKLRESTTKEDIDYWDKRQLVRKILLNSAYGALLNEHCRFYDKRIGQSVTLTGRSVTKHMSAHVNEIITGVYDHTGDSMIYGDTDSCYFSAWPMLKDDLPKDMTLANKKQTFIDLYDSMSDQCNESFPGFMESAFHCPRSKGEIIRGGREVCGDRGLFITKKRYAINIYDNEGKRTDANGAMYVKAMGLDLKRADTPKYVQNFLKEVLEMTLSGLGREDIIEKVKEFKLILGQQDSWTKGSPKGVNKLTSYTQLEKKSKTGRANMPGHVRAAMNWNTLKRVHGDNYSMEIMDGFKVVVCKLKPNPMGYTSIAYPTDQLRLPEWFQELPFDDNLMESTLVDEKISNLLGVLKWDLRANTDTNSTFDELFSFG
jgi:DNA polymerase elongation subunit (family B)